MIKREYAGILKSVQAGNHGFEQTSVNYALKHGDSDEYAFLEFILPTVSHEWLEMFLEYGSRVRITITVEGAKG